MFFLGITIGNIYFNYSTLKRLNVYDPLTKSDLHIISYDECIRRSYLDYLPINGSITLLEGPDDVIPYLDAQIQILDIGYDEGLVFKNEKCKSTDSSDKPFRL